MKLRILCLHGYTQNATVFSKRTAVLRKDLKDIADCVYVTAPFKIREQPNATELDQEEMQYTWWYANDDRTIYEGYEDSIDFLKRQWAENGPFDGILGFSQGAAMTALFAYELLKSDPSIYKHPKFAILISGFKSTALSHRDIVTNDKVRGIPSMHVYGEKDEWVVPSRSIALVDWFDRETAVVVAHKRGHFVPTDAENRILFKQFLLPFCAAANL